MGIKFNLNEIKLCKNKIIYFPKLVVPATIYKKHDINECIWE